MSKNTEIKLVGQPILSQLLQLVDKWSFKKNGSTGILMRLVLQKYFYDRIKFLQSSFKVK